MSVALFFGNILSLAGIAAGVYYLITSRRINTTAETPDPISLQAMRIIRRRRFGSSLMILIAVMFMVATNWFADVHTAGMSFFWLLLMVLLLWLLILAAIDLLAIGRLRQNMIDQANDKIQKLISDKKNESTDESGHDENDQN